MSIPETPNPNAGPPKWLIYGAAIITGVLWWKGFIF